MAITPQGPPIFNVPEPESHPMKKQENRPPPIQVSETSASNSAQTTVRGADNKLQSDAIRQKVVGGLSPSSAQNSKLGAATSLDTSGRAMKPGEKFVTDIALNINKVLRIADPQTATSKFVKDTNELQQVLREQFGTNQFLFS